MEFIEKKYVNENDFSSRSAFSYDQTVLFKLYIPRRIGACSVCMHLYGEGIENRLYEKIEFVWTCFDGAQDVYEACIDMGKIGVGLYYYEYEIASEKRLFLGSVDGRLSLRDENSDCKLQLLVHKEKSTCAKWMHGGIMYQIFVDRFKKSGKCTPKSTAIMNEDWYNGIPQYASVPGGYVENNMFFGGDLYGVCEKLDYLKSLGVTCLYLCPIFDAYSNHKYDTGDYMTVDSMFGSEEAFDLLVSEIKKRDMHLILDGVFNHTGADSIYFNKFNRYSSLGAYQSKESKYYGWYNFRSYPDDYECWWNVKILPRVNSNNESYQEYILGDGGVIEKWMKKGVDGFRLDVADELSDEFLQRLNQKLKSINPDGIIYGEVWEDASNKIAYGKRKKYFLGNELDSVMNYPLKDAVINYVKFGDWRGFSATCHMLYSHYPKHNTDLLMNLLGTHDTERILTVLGGDSAEGLCNGELSTKKMSKAQRKNAINLLKLAYTIIATVPGIPCIYYGDEAGMEGYRDPFNRLPYPWGKEETELLEFYKTIGKIRLSEKVFKEGDFKIIECNEDLLAYMRYDESGFVVVAVNRGDTRYYIDSNVSLKNCKNGRSVKVIQPCSSHILKCNSSANLAKVEFYK